MIGKQISSHKSINLLVTTSNTNVYGNILTQSKKPMFVNYCQTYKTCAAACLALLNMPMLTNQNHSKRTGFAVGVQYILSEYCWTQFPYPHKKTRSRSDEVEKVVTMLQERKLQKCKAGKREKKLTKQTETIVSMWKTAWSPDRNSKAVHSRAATVRWMEQAVGD